MNRDGLPLPFGLSLLASITSGALVTLSLARLGTVGVAFGLILGPLPLLGLAALWLLRSRWAVILVGVLIAGAIIAWAGLGVWAAGCWDCAEGVGSDPPTREFKFAIYTWLGVLGLSASITAALLITVAARVFRRGQAPSVT